MEVTSIGQYSSLSNNQSGNSNQTKISSLESQKEKIQEKIEKLNRDKTVSSSEKQQEIQAYQTQIATLNAQIQELEQKQSAKSSNQQENTIKSSNRSSTQNQSSDKRLQAGVDIEA